MPCFLACPMGLVQSLVPVARPMKFSTPIGATFENSVQCRSPAVVWMMAVGSAAAPSSDVQTIRTSVYIRVRMDAPVGCFCNLQLYDKGLYDSRSELAGGEPGVPSASSGQAPTRWPARCTLRLPPRLRSGLRQNGQA